MCEIHYFLFIIFLTCVFAKDGPLINTPNGLIRGTYQTSTNGRTFSSFDGIPYAKPPINDLRFREPIPIEPWLGVLIADTQYVCIQYNNGTVLGQEDCLYINVYVPRETPDPDEKLDVIVHIHGGAFMLGSGHMNGPNHFMDRDVLFVNFNYRLGPFGFSSSGDEVIPGNYGLKDQTAALQWIKDNIQVFGGNPDSVTITGLSAGGASVHLHYFSDMSKELFHRGFAQSGSALNPWAIQNDPFENTKKLATAVGCFNENVKIVLSCLRQRSALQMAENIKLFYVDVLMPLAPFAPVVEVISESSFMNVHPYMQLLSNRVLDKPLIMSTTTEEGLLPSGFFYNKLDVLNEKWEKLFPLMLEYYNESEDKQHEVSKKIKEHYFNDDAISKENFEQLIKLCTHRLFHTGAEISLRMQAKITNSPVYFLMMGYYGENSLFQYYIGSDDELGVFAKDGPLIKTPNGLIKGKYQTSTNGRTFSSFDGIPYAKPPINKLRFREPIPIEPWLGVLIADTQYVCMQYANGTVLGQEDCLYINVYVPRETPDPEEKLDVIVHIHGGAFMVGAGHMYTGPNHFMDRDVVFVNFNYRLGPFGFLSSGDRVIPGNYGLKDQTAALQWVKDNIQVFGGNPDSVTITGLSAGGASVHLHYFSNMSKELFHRGIAQSGSALNPWAIKNDPFDNTKKLATAVGCFDENVKIVLSCLRQRSALQMAENIKLFYVDMFLPLAPFAPVVEFISESTFMNVHPYMQLLTNRVLDKPLIMSMTTEEGVLPSGLFYHKLDVLNEKWEKLSPLMMEYYNEPEDKQHEVSKKIKEHYFNDDAISKENFEQFLKLCSQRLFHAGAELSLRMQAKITNSPVYLLMMGYSGESSMSKYYLGIDDKFGVGHGDDAKFYYNLPMLNNKLNKEEKKMKDDLLDMVVTYAKTGKPTITNVEWKPVDDGEYINYLQIKGPDDISMKKTKELSPNNFWNSLGLRENENAYVLKGKFVEVL